VTRTRPHACQAATILPGLRDRASRHECCTVCEIARGAEIAANRSETHVGLYSLAFLLGGRRRGEQ
jgi:hypothetical protein